ncbi:MAG TPA: polysaccharide ABC transporter ATP-binding protein [Thermoanaerobaculia bacterium]|jgi:lipopolysaccharide transport system ATP-binding protein
MTPPAVTVENLSKKYRLGDVHTDLLSERLSRLLRRRGQSNAAAQKEFWALRDIGFEVHEGEVLGIIGRNGAGKSTLLKILSRLTAPTTGKAVVRGRLASLLEVGMGFHPELSGRENIFLNGTILGMKRREIGRRFDEIVAFSGVEEFLDTPVKRYSSGMYVRLAFAVAAHVEADILIIDEVLAVGDAEFQKRCLGKMDEVARGGRTVLFVSHNLPMLRKLCTTALLLDEGQLLRSGTAEECIEAYQSRFSEHAAAEWVRPANADPAGADPPKLAITRVSVALHGTQPAHVLDVDLTFETRAEHKPALLAIYVTDTAGAGVVQVVPRQEPFLAATSVPRRIRVSIDLPPLIPGRYLISVWIGVHAHQPLDAVRSVTAFEIHDFPTPGRTFPYSPQHGFTAPPSRVIDIAP